MKRLGNRKTRVYNIWSMMRQRCDNPRTAAYCKYGAIGIKVCDEWRSFDQFLADMGIPEPHQTLDRKDNSLGYNKDNCRWADDVQQARNKRTNRMIEFRGETLPMVAWAERLNLCYVVTAKRIRSGWTAERAFTTPTNKPYVPFVPGSKTKTPRVRAARSSHQTNQSASAQT